MLKQVGFTFIELIIVILLISIISAYAIFTWPGLSLNLDGQAQQLADDLRYTQSLAMTQGQRFQLVVTGNTYQIQNNAGTAIALAVGGTTVTLNSGITFGTLTTSTLIFNGKGIPYSNSTTPLSAVANFPLTTGTVTETVVVTPTTGRVTVQ